MSVYVDELQVWPHARHRCFKQGSCHLSADTIPELHVFAQQIGMRRSWFQDHPLMPHYDLSPARREAALAAGAIFKPAREQARERQARRAELGLTTADAIRLARGRGERV